MLQGVYSYHKFNPSWWNFCDCDTNLVYSCTPEVYVYTSVNLHLFSVTGITPTWCENTLLVYIYTASINLHFYGVNIEASYFTPTWCKNTLTKVN